MDSYYVTIRSAWPAPTRHVTHYLADDFAHAEEQAVQDLAGYGSDAEIIIIEKDYK